LRLITIATILLIAFGAVCADDAQKDADLADQILWLVSKPVSRIKPHWGTRAMTDLHYRLRLARAARVAADRFDVPVLLLLTIGYRETVFRPLEVGDVGRSLGIMQVGIMGRRKCKEFCKEIKTVEGGTMCGACWLDKGRQWCGSLHGGLMAYVSGKCKAKTPAAHRTFNSRLLLWNQLKTRELRRVNR